MHNKEAVADGMPHLRSLPTGSDWLWYTWNWRAYLSLDADLTLHEY